MKMENKDILKHIINILKFKGYFIKECEYNNIHLITIVNSGNVIVDINCTYKKITYYENTLDFEISALIYLLISSIINQSK